MLSGLWLCAACVWGVAAQGPQEDASGLPGDSPDRWIRVLQQHLEGNTSEDKEACRHAAQALGEIGPAAAAAVPVLTQATARSVEVRNFAVDALGRIGPAAAASVPAILKEVDLPKDHVNYVPLAFFRLLAARALGRIGPEARQAIPLLQATLQSDDVAYRVEAAVAMWKIARHQGQPCRPSRRSSRTIRPAAPTKRSWRWQISEMPRNRRRNCWSRRWAASTPIIAVRRPRC